MFMYLYFRYYDKYVDMIGFHFHYATKFYVLINHLKNGNNVMNKPFPPIVFLHVLSL